MFYWYIEDGGIFLYSTRFPFASVIVFVFLLLKQVALISMLIWPQRLLPSVPSVSLAPNMPTSQLTG